MHFFINDLVLFNPSFIETTETIILDYQKGISIFKCLYTHTFFWNNFYINFKSFSNSILNLKYEEIELKVSHQQFSYIFNLSLCVNLLLHLKPD